MKCRFFLLVLSARNNPQLTEHWHCSPVFMKHVVSLVLSSIAMQKYFRLSPHVLAHA